MLFHKLLYSEVSTPFPIRNPITWQPSISLHIFKLICLAFVDRAIMKWSFWLICEILSIEDRAVMVSDGVPEELQ